MVPKTFPPGKITIFLSYSSADAGSGDGASQIQDIPIQTSTTASVTLRLHDSRQKVCAGFLQLSKMSLSMLSQSLQENAAN